MTDKILLRLKRIKGQVEGITRMYEECRGCAEIVVQIEAAREALAAVGKKILTDEAVACSRPSERGKLDELLKKLFKIS